MRRPLTVALVALLLTAGLTLPIGGLHTDPPLHGDQDLQDDVAVTLLLHCVPEVDNNGDPQDACNDDKPDRKALQAAAVGSDPPGNRDDVDGFVEYRFVDARTGEWNTTAQGQISTLEATLYIADANIQGEFQIEFIVDGDIVGTSGEVDSKGLQTTAYGFTIDEFTQDGDTVDTYNIEEGQPFRLNVTQEDSDPVVGDDFTLRLHTQGTPSRIVLTGNNLLRTRGWLEPPTDGVKTAFNLEGAEASRTFTPVMALEPALGNATVGPAHVGHAHGTGLSLRQHNDANDASAELSYDVVDEGDEANPDGKTLDQETGCDETALEEDFVNSTGRYVTLRILQKDQLHEVVPAGNACLFPDDNAFDGTYNGRFTAKIPELTFDNTDGDSIDVPTVQCEVDDDCVHVETFDLVRFIDLEMSMDEDDDVKEVLAGETVHYNVLVRNGLSSSTTFDLSLEGPATDGWTAELSTSQVSVPAGESRSITVRLTAPKDAAVNEEAQVTVNATLEDLPSPPDLTLTGIASTSSTIGSSLRSSPDEVTAAPGETGTFLVDVKNDGNAKDTIHVSLVGLPGNFSADISTRTLSLEAGERRQIRLRVHVPDEVRDEFIDQVLSEVTGLGLEARSTTGGDVLATEPIDLRVFGTYEFELSTIDRIHPLRTSVATPDQTCGDVEGETTFGTWFRFTINNTGGNPDVLRIVDDVSDESIIADAVEVSDDEELNDWNTALYRAPIIPTGSGEDPDEFKLEDSDGDGTLEVDLPGGNTSIGLYMLAWRDKDGNEQEGPQTGSTAPTANDQCEQSPNTNPWSSQETFNVTVELESQNSPATSRDRVRLTVEGDPSAIDPDLLLERHHRVQEPLAIATPPKPFAISPDEPATRTFRLTNAGNYKCFEGANPDPDVISFRDATVEGLPGWTVDIDTTNLEAGFRGAELPPGDNNDQNVPVSFGEIPFTADFTLAEQAEANQTVSGTVVVTYDCSVDPESVQESILDVPPPPETTRLPIEFIVLPDDGLDVSSPKDTVTVTPGGRTLVNVEVKNTGTTRPTYNASLSTSSLPQGWSAQIEGVASLPVPPLSGAVVPVGISAPADAAEGDVGPVRLDVVGSRGDLNASIDLTAEVVDPGNSSLEPSPDTAGTKPAQPVTYDLILTNGEDDTVTIVDEDVEAGAFPLDWQASVLHDGSSDFSLDVPAGGSETLQVEVQPPTDALSVSTVGTTVLVDPDEFTLSASVKTHVAQEFGVDLSADRPSRAVQTGRSAQYSLRVRNAGNGADTVALEHETPPAGWDVALSDTSVVLAAEETTTVFATVTPPSGASPGTSAPIQVRASSRSDPRQTARLELVTAVASYDPELHGKAPSRRAGPGEPINYEVRLMNNGTGSDLIQLSATAKPNGWSVDFSEPSPNVDGNGTRDITLTITPAADAPPRSEGVVVVEARSTKADPPKTDTMSFRLTIHDYLARDVDGDGIEEAAVDKNRDPQDGFEVFQETAPTRGVDATQILALDGDGDGTQDFLLDTSGDLQADLYWSPLGDVLTETLVLDMTGDGIDEALVDFDDDGIVDAIHLEGSDRVGPATSFDVDDDLEREHLADTDGDDLLDAYFDDGDPRPGHAVRTTVAVVTANQYAVDTDGDGSHDKVFDTQSRTTRAFTILDGAIQLVTIYWYAVVLFLLVVSLFAAARLTSPKEPYVYDRYDED